MLRQKFLVPTALIFLGALFGYGGAFVQSQFAEQKFLNSFYPLRVNDASLALVHPLVAYETPEATVLSEYAMLKRRVEDLVSRTLREGDVKEVSVYYRNVETGRWVGINEEEAYYPASLLKVPLMIAYFKAREPDPHLFDRSIVYREAGPDFDYEAPSQLIVGKAYTVRQLIEHMIEDSDNGATFALLERIDPDLLISVYRRLGIEDPGEDSSTYQIPTGTYARFFRTLYNGTYLTPSASEEALQMLSKATYKDGLVAGVPEGTIVAHKFGEHVVVEDGEPVGEELHDCGLIYAKERPYLLCVMTRAKTLEAATNVISSVSRLVYENESNN